MAKHVCSVGQTRRVLKQLGAHSKVREHSRCCNMWPNMHVQWAKHSVCLNSCARIAGCAGIANIEHAAKHGCSGGIAQRVLKKMLAHSKVRGHSDIVACGQARMLSGQMIAWAERVARA